MRRILRIIQTKVRSEADAYNADLGLNNSDIVKAEFNNSFIIRSP